MRLVQIAYEKQAEKFFAKHEDIRQEFVRCIKQLFRNDHPEQVNNKRLKGKHKGHSRIAIGSYRIIYKVINGDIIIVSVVAAGSRGDVYKHL
ncbi:MAG: type II toxin-antitoxin system mRNA interferase toxin, RelE/StbE family [Synergistaceae bacterium]|nr:type II toxin-antitoxin system mRNA interferase toxin, RelE/StbE family [Synergistaceae bacterium]